MSNLIKRASDFIVYGLWRKTGEEMSRWKRFAYLTLRSIILTVKGFLNHNINIRANALTYSMMFATVPILALVLAIAKGFGFEQVIEEKLYESFLGQMNVVPTIMGFVERYLETAQGGAFIGVGLLVLLWSVWSFFNNIETSFNTIWQVKRSRSYVRQLTTYVAVLLLVPILMVVSSGVSIFLNTATASIEFFEAMAPLKEFFLRLLPFLTCWLIFSWMYWAIPNTKVGAWAAFIPGIVVGTLFQLLQMLTVYLVAFLSRTSIVYGVFAAIPLLLTWLQLSCLFILSGAELSFAIQNNEDFDYDHDLQHMSRRYKDYVTLYLTWLIVCRFRDGKEPQTAHEMAKENRLPARLVNQLLGRLSEIGIVRESYTEGKEDRTYVPGHDISTLTVNEVADCIDRQGTELFLQHPTPEQERFWQQFIALREGDKELSNILIRDIL
ncbi:MAG: YihY/virulence factor BrkB family protein [Paludibacteraceae bacterium]|nr:YihY/virulence factor BrkB family protein [Paludibacteraceae bacterium]